MTDAKNETALTVRAIPISQKNGGRAFSSRLIPDKRAATEYTLRTVNIDSFLTQRTHKVGEEILPYIAKTTGSTQQGAKAGGS